MPEYLSPGVYIEEFEMGAKPIEGVSTSTAGFLGEVERGPTVPEKGFVTSWFQYQRVFGSYFGADKYLPYAVQGFFDNGGQRCYIARIVKADAAAAALILPETDGSNALTVAAVGEGSWGNRIAVKASPGTFGGFKLSVFYWKTAPASLYDPEEDATTTPRPSAEEIFDNLSVDEESPDYYGKKVNGGISNLIEISALSGDPPEVGHVGTAQAGGVATITLDSGEASTTNGAYNGMRIKITNGTGSDQIRTITDYNGATLVATVDSNWGTEPDNTSEYRLYWFRALENGAESVPNAGTAQDGDAGPPPTITLAASASADDDTYNEMQIEITGGQGSGQIRTITAYDGATQVAQVNADWNIGEVPDGTSQYRVVDSNPDLVLADYERTDTDGPGERKGLTGFAAIDPISIVYAPNSQDVPGLVGSIVSHCETRLKDRFGIIDSTLGSATISNIDPRGTTTGANSGGNTQYAAFYYPWIKILDPAAGLQRTVPPGGHIAGIYARSDTERGVHKAPANETVRGAVGLEFQITKGEHDILNPRGVNVIRAFPGRGIYVWGARTLSTNTLWKYINVRRLFIFLEESIDEGTQWVVFEPNDQKLWARVRATITEFLTRVWRDGALFGSTPDEAFFVKCDETTMTQDDINNGRLICVIGVAPVRPAEFVIFRIAQLTGSAE